MRSALLLAGLTGLASCAPVDAPDYADPRTRLGRELAGRVAGAPASCIPHHRTQNMIPVGPDTLLFRHGSTIYMNRLRGGCGALGSGMHTLVIEPTGGGLCSGDLIKVADIHTFTVLGACSLGHFIPFTKVAG